MSGGRTLHVRCTTWDQVEVFYTRKLRKGKLLSMKVPFAAKIGAQVTLGLELPNQVVLALDGKIHKATPMADDAAKTWIEIELVGFNDAVIARLKAMMAGAELPEDPTPPPVASPIVTPIADRPSRRAPSPSLASGSTAAGAPPLRRPAPPIATEALPSDERELFHALTGELRRLRQLAVHEVLGVDRDADAEAIRTGWMALVRRLHPDLVARHQAPAITHLAEELTILCNRAYDRLRAALVLEGRATAPGSLLQQTGWLLAIDDMGSRAITAAEEAALSDDDTVLEDARIASSLSSFGTIPPPISGAQNGETFETRARAMLSNGEADNAQEVLAAALCVYPRSRPLRSLYYVASALAALTKGELMLATSQLETALAHHEQCVEAAQILEHLKKHGPARTDELRRFFR